MANFQYHVVKTDKGELESFYGSKRPNKMPENTLEADEMELRLVPLTWEILHSCDDDESAQKKLEEELAKLPDQKKGQAKGKE